MEQKPCVNGMCLQVRKPSVALSKVQATAEMISPGCEVGTQVHQDMEPEQLCKRLRDIVYQHLLTGCLALVCVALIAQHGLVIAEQHLRIMES